MYVLFLYLFISMCITYTIFYLHTDARVQHRHTDTTYICTQRKKELV